MHIVDRVGGGDKIDSARKKWFLDFCGDLLIWIFIMRIKNQKKLLN